MLNPNELKFFYNLINYQLQAVPTESSNQEPQEQSNESSQEQAQDNEDQEPQEVIINITNNELTDDLTEEEVKEILEELE